MKLVSHWTEDRRHRVRDLASQGLRNSELALAMGVSRSSVAGICDRMGIKVTSNRHPVFKTTMARSEAWPLSLNPTPIEVTR